MTENAAEAQQDDVVIPLASRARIGATTVGVMTAVRRDTGLIARLTIQGEGGESAKVVLSPGDEFSLFDEGQAVLVDVRIPETVSAMPGGSAATTPSVVIRRLEG
ncbi:hypothetical protein [Antribacter gilvus]|uniref:hypothetical protein n=1 Tax=Antribacter gilvus TaxID=2304675 RepID=UPI000F77B0A6|nr:hypothetical protein [Antribacter gilvus]